MPAFGKVSRTLQTTRPTLRFTNPKCHKAGHLSITKERGEEEAFVGAQWGHGAIRKIVT